MYKMQSESSCKDPWQKSDTLHLIKLISEFKSSSDSEKVNNNELYIQAANKLFEYGISRTYIQCKSKWKELVETYNDYKKTQTGDPPPFYTELDKMLSETFSEYDSTGEGMNPFGAPWTQYETTFLIKVMKVGNFINKLKTEEPMNVYEQIAQYMQKVGPITRSKEDIQQRWRNLKQSYIKYIKGDLLHFKYFELMDALLDWEPNSIAFEEDQFKDGHEYGDETYQNPDDYEIKGAPSSKRALNWTHKETEVLLDVVQKYNLKQMKRDDIAAVFDEASMQLRLQSFKRSSEQCRVKFKHLKVKYFSALKKLVNGNDHPERYFYHFDRMREIMQSLNSDGNTDTDNENSDFTQDSEHYEVEYLEDHLDDGEQEPETFAKVFLKEENHSKFSCLPKHNRKGRVIWSQTETQYLLNLLKAKNVKRYCRRQTFEEIAQEMTKAGYKRSSQMCMIKWKNLRNQLYSCIRNMVEGKDELCPFYDEICEIVQKNGQVDISLISDQDHGEFDESEDQFEAEDSSDHKFHDTSLENDDLEPNKSPEKVGNVEGSERNNKNPLELETLETNEKKRPCPVEKQVIEMSSVVHENKKFKNSETNTESTNDADDSSRYVCNYKMDDTEHYCMSLATTFKRLSKKKQAKLKIELQKLLYSAEFDEEF